MFIVIPESFGNLRPQSLLYGVDFILYGGLAVLFQPAPVIVDIQNDIHILGITIIHNLLHTIQPGSFYLIVRLILHISIPSTWNAHGIETGSFYGTDHFLSHDRVPPFGFSRVHVTQRISSPHKTVFVSYITRLQRITQIPAEFDLRSQSHGITLHTDIGQLTGKLFHRNGFRKISQSKGDGSFASLTIVSGNAKGFGHRRHCTGSGLPYPAIMNGNRNIATRSHIHRKDSTFGSDRLGRTRFHNQPIGSQLHNVECFRQATTFHGNSSNTFHRIRIFVYRHRVLKYCSRSGSSGRYGTPILIAGDFQRNIRLDRERVCSPGFGETHSIRQNVLGNYDFRGSRCIVTVGASCHDREKGKH